MLENTEKMNKLKNGKSFDFCHFLCYNRNVVERDIKPLLTLKYIIWKEIITCLMLETK